MQKIKKILMKKQTRAMLFLTCMLGVVCGCGPSDPDIVFQAYSQAFLEPETFDEYARQQLSPRADDFFACLADVEEGLIKAHQKAVAHCDGLPAEYQSNCRETTYAQISGALSAIASVVRGQVSWTETGYYMSAIIAKREVPELYDRTLRALLPVYKPVFVCR